MAYQRKFTRPRTGDEKLDRILQQIYDEFTGLLQRATGGAGTLGDMMKSLYDVDEDGKVEAADAADAATNADTVDGQHANEFAPASHAHGDALPAGGEEGQMLVMGALAAAWGKRITVSEYSPSGGDDDDVWIQKLA